MTLGVLVLTVMPEYIVKPAESVNESRLRVELRGDDYVTFGEALEGEEATSEYRTNDVDLGEALRAHPLLQVERVDEVTDENVEVRPSKGDLVNESLDEDDRRDGDAIRAVLFPDEDDAKPADRATSAEVAPQQPEPPRTHLSQFPTPDSQEDSA